MYSILTSFTDKLIHGFISSDLGLHFPGTYTRIKLAMLSGAICWMNWAGQVC